MQQMREKKELDPQLKASYFDMIQRTIHSLDALIYEIENDGLHNQPLRDQFYELAVDCVPLVKKLNEAKRYAQGSISHFKL